MDDGSEQPIAYASHSLSMAEWTYAQIKKEVLFIVYGVKKFHQYLYGQAQFTIVSNHWPLQHLLTNPEQSLQWP